MALYCPTSPALSTGSLSTISHVGKQSLIRYIDPECLAFCESPLNKILSDGQCRREDQWTEMEESSERHALHWNSKNSQG
jgi:hypothetical protein